MRKEVQKVLRDNERRRADRGEGFATYDANRAGGVADGPNAERDPMVCLLGMREYNVPCIVRV